MGGHRYLHLVVLSRIYFAEWKGGVVWMFKVLPFLMTRHNFHLILFITVFSMGLLNGYGEL